MRVDLPKLNRCCCCIPLRYGLIVWGYVKMIITVLLLIPVSIKLVHIFQSGHNLPVFDTLVISTYALSMVVDICCTIVFLIGGHQKNVKLLQIYYIYSLVMFCLLTLFYTCALGNAFYHIGRYVSMSHDPLYYLETPYVLRTLILLGVLLLGTQMYVILLTKNEITKLRNNAQFRFTNVATEAQCTLENGTDERGTDDLNERTDDYGNGISNQFVEIINQNNNADRENYSYNKF